MPYISNAAPSKFRLLISGFSNTGKTTSFSTFIYGPYDYWDVDQQEDAVEYAGDNHMVIIECPGETGHRALPKNTPHITSYYDEASENEDVTGVSWSKHALDQFFTLFNESVKLRPGILCLDGIHGLWKHIMNRVTEGAYLDGEDLSLNEKTGRADTYRAAALHNRTHNTFDHFIDALYKCPIEMIVCTTREEWESGTTEGAKAGDIAATRYLWPNIPGKMAKELPGKFDARVSSRLEKRCLHNNCEDSKQLRDHHVWQFYPKNDVQGVGIKGLKVSQAMKDKPWIHQSWDKLKMLIDQFS